MKKIVFSTDFSQESITGAREILNYLKTCSGSYQFLLLNTYLVKHTDPNEVIQLNDKMKRESLEGLHRMKDTLTKEVGESSPVIELASHMGSTQNVIQNILGKEKFEMVPKNEISLALNLIKSDGPTLILV